MKKNLLISLLAVFYFSGIQAQGFWLDITGGYAAPIAGSLTDFSSSQIQLATFPNYAATNRQLSYMSYGQAGNVALNLNWFSKHDIGAGIKLNAQITSPFDHTAYVSYIDGTSANFNYKEKAFSFQFIPHISFKHDFKVVCPVLEMGAIVGITDLTEDYQGTRSTGNSFSSSVKYSGGAMLGFYSSLGVKIKVTKVVAVLLAVNCSVASYSPTEWKRTSYIYDGQNQLGYMPVSLTQGVYVKSLDLTAVQNPNQPQQGLKFNVPFSNIGFTAGLAFKLSKSAKKAKALLEGQIPEETKKKKADIKNYWTPDY